jgi:hypothetical protein
MKKGAIAGVMSGVIAGIISFFIYLIYSSVGILEPKIFVPMFLVRQAMIHIGFNVLWGLVFGIIFALIFDKIPGKGNVKGLWIGLIYSILSIIRPTIFIMPYLLVSALAIWGLAYIVGLSLATFVYGILFVNLYKVRA